MAYDDQGLSDEFKADLAAGTLVPQRQSSVGNIERTLAHTASIPANIFSSVGGSMASLFGSPRHTPDPSTLMPPADDFMGKASDVLVGGVAPVIGEMMAGGSVVRSMMGAARVAKNPIMTRMLSDALGLGLVGAEESAAVGGEQAAEGLGYGALTALPRMKRLLPAAALALGSKAFFDHDGGTPFMEGSQTTRGDINALAGFLTAFVPGMPKGAAAKTPLQKIPASQISPTGPAVPKQLNYTPPEGREGYRDPIEMNRATMDVDFRPAKLLPFAGNDNRFAPISDLSAVQTEQQILQRVPFKKDAIAMGGPVATDSRWNDIVDPGRSMRMPPLSPAAIASVLGDPLQASAMNQQLDNALVLREANNRAAKVMGASNPKASPMRRKGAFAELPEYKRSEGGFMTEEAAIQLAKAGGRGLIGAAFGGGAAAADDDPMTDPRTAAILGAAAFAFGPRITSEVLDRIGNWKRAATKTPMNREAGSVMSPTGQAGQSNLTASVQKNMNDAMMMTGNNPVKAAAFLDNYVTKLREKGNIEAAANFEAASNELKKNLARVETPPLAKAVANTPAQPPKPGVLQSLQKAEAGFVMPEMSQAMARATIGGLVGSFVGGMTDDSDERGGLVMGGLIGAGAAMFGPAIGRSIVRAISKTKTTSPPSGKASTMKDWVKMMQTIGTTIEEKSGATITRGSTRIADRFARVLSRNLELFLPEAVKSKLLESKGLASLFLDQIDSAILKVALRYNPDDIVKGIANQYLDGTIDSAAFLKQLQPHMATNSQVENYAKFMMAGRESVNGLQRMLVSGIGDPKMRSIVDKSIGSYLTKSYRLFTDPHWNPEESSINNLIAEIHAKNAFGVGATTPDIENALRQYIREVKVNKGAYGISNFAGGTKINQAILKERKDMSDEWRKFLGEITDPTERIYQTVFRLRPMAEASKYFESLIKLEADGLPQAFRNYAEKDAFRGKLLQQLQNPLISEADKIAINQKLSRLAAFQNVEAHPKFGAIQGHIVSLPVWDTLQTFDSATNTFSHPFLRSLSNVHTAIKLGRTAFNPMTVIRNMVTSPMFMVIGRTGTKDLTEAWHIIHQADHPLREEALKQGIMNVDQVKTEFYKEFQNITGSRFNFGNIDLTNLGMGTFDLDVAEKASRRGVRSILDFYRLPDNVVRIGAYLSAKRRIAESMGRGMDDAEVISKATEFTNRYTMNYDAVAPAIKNIRQLPFANLFISYTAEMARIGKNLIADVIQGDQGNLARHGRMYAALPLATLAILPEMLQMQSESSLSPKDKADWEKAKRLMPDYARTRYRAGISRDKRTGQFRYVDFTPLIASDSFNQLIKAVASGDLEAAAAVNPVLSWENTPALNIVAEQIAGKDKRTFREFRGGADRVAAVAKEVLPPWMPGGGEWNRFRQSHTRTDEGDLGITNLKTGIRLTPSDFWATYFGPLAGQIVPPGAKVGSLNLGVLEKRVTQEIKNEVANETAYLNDILKSNTNDEQKARAVERFKVSIATLQENYRARLGEGE